MHIFQVDAFTRRPFTGNPATVVLDADALDDAAMRAVAREFPHAECAFVLRPGTAGEDIAVRFFNARKEAPFVGHATIAAHAVLLAIGRRGYGTLRQRSAAGVIEVAARGDPAADGAPATIEFRRAAPRLEAPLPLKTALRVAEALGLPGERLHESLAARACRDGGSRLLLPLAGLDALDLLGARTEPLIALGRELDVDGFFAFAFRRGPDGATTESRMFCPALGIPEDPVSGNAHAMLAAYLLEAGLLRPADGGFLGFQGKQLGRPGRVEVRIEFDGALPRAMHVGGNAVIVSDGTLVA
ncbi:MAG TPA: PhzF family phenazine biosynthesis isomerase [Steroidobacteraceae bacterium]|nr:PhzF family phenazine biosynthesis isomerase [Steroidobacteraceae bacterium]